MKRILSVLVVIVLLGITSLSYGQNKLKIGHINSNELLDKMSGRDSAKTKLEKYYKDLEGQIKAMQQELETKYTDYQTNEKNMTDLIKKTKMAELKDMQDRIDNFQKSAQEDFQKKQNEIFKPIIDKVKKAIEDVAKENGYSYVLDSSANNVVLFAEPSDDILPLVKKKLGLK